MGLPWLLRWWIAVVVVVYWRVVVGGCWEGVEVEDIEQRLTKGVPRDVRVGVNGRAEFHVTSTKKHSWTRNKGVRRLTAVKMFTCMYVPTLFCVLGIVAYRALASPLHTQTRIRVKILSPVLYEHRDEDGHGYLVIFTVGSPLRDW